MRKGDRDLIKQEKLEINKIYNMDCLEGMKLIPDKSIDCIICDLPYGTTACKWDIIIPFDKLWEQYERIIKDNGAIVLFGSEPFSSYLRISNIKLFRYDWIWEKTIGTGNMNCNKMPIKKHETISVFYKKLPIYNPQMTEGTPYKDNRAYGTRRNSDELYGSYVEHSEVIDNKGTRYPISVIKFSNPNHNRLHKTQKPIELIEYLVKTYTNEGQLILDNCMGSGTTAVACINTNRNYIGFELDKKYYDLATERINKSNNKD